MPTKVKSHYTVIELSARWRMSHWTLRKIIDRLVPRCERFGLARMVPHERLDELWALIIKSEQRGDIKPRARGRFRRTKDCAAQTEARRSHGHIEAEAATA
jgi:LDH2 family malate/lactate/ureidoglycolate dehydrogenase